MSVRTVKVSNVSHSATEKDINEFFSFSGDIDHVELKSFDEWSRVAYVTFRDFQGAETAMLLSGATIIDQSVIITSATDYQPPRIMSLPPPYEESKSTNGSQSVVRKAEDVVTTMLAKGYVLGKAPVDKAKSFDEKHRITSTATSKVVSLDRKIGLSEKISAGASAVNGKVREVDQRFQVSGKTKSAISVAEQKVSSAGSAMLKNKYIFSGVSFVTGAFSKVGQAASDVGSKTKEKVMAEKMKKGTF
ncbi:hypothetical protein IEQ34_000616 [Dendrobium chrysotoxum]|uniref:RRM domain-containing protein n=1 Tax=Dendrobium chrysotoxum TaxID=161865 RepID=A0AAV7HSP6_DENCH|nr:hypothetical protein IEQ34_000616 [Dendrobium chrysotoxum]